MENLEIIAISEINPFIITGNDNDEVFIIYFDNDPMKWPPLDAPNKYNGIGFKILIELLFWIFWVSCERIPSIDPVSRGVQHLCSRLIELMAIGINPMNNNYI